MRGFMKYLILAICVLCGPANSATYTDSYSVNFASRKDWQTHGAEKVSYEGYYGDFVAEGFLAKGFNAAKGTLTGLRFDYNLEAKTVAEFAHAISYQFNLAVNPGRGF